MQDKQKKWWIFGITSIFLLINTLFIINEFFWFPAIVGIILVAMFAFFSSDKLLLLITFLTPLSVDLNDKLFNVGISLPSEALMIVLAAIFCLRIFKENNYDIKITKHPISIAIIVYLVWMLFASILSEIPLVSFKFLAAKLWFILSFYFFAILVFRKNIAQVKKFIWLYALSLIVVIIYTTYNHSTYGFDESVGHWVMKPFYNDHTSYGAVLAMYSVVMFGLLFEKGNSRFIKIATLTVFILLFTGLFLSFSRAAWVSVVAALGVYFILRFRIKYYWILSLVILAAGVFFVFEQEIMIKMSKNNQDSSTNFVEHVESISNISTDASNLERLNRWSSAFRLFDERPFTGWGPGCYQFVYGPYQHARDKTIISTNAGTGGNAHSEYIGPLAESGIFGLLTFLSIIILTIIYGNRTYFKAKNQNIKIITVISLLALITYYIHGFLNNFLDTDKLSVPFWGFTAIIVTMNIYYLEKPAEEKED